MDGSAVKPATSSTWGEALVTDSIAMVATAEAGSDTFKKVVCVSCCLLELGYSTDATWAQIVRPIYLPARFTCDWQAA